MSGIDAVFFDLDDTLFDATGLAEKARMAAIESMIENGLAGVAPDHAYAVLQEVVSEFGSNYDGHFNMFLRRLNQHSSRLVSIAIITYHRIKVQEIKLFPDVFEFLQNLRNMTSCTMGIITDGIPVKQHEKIFRLGLDPFFPHVFISDEMGIRKPNAKLFELALVRTGQVPGRCLYIGDRFDHDILPAMKAGMQACWIHRKGKHDLPAPPAGGHRIDYEIADLGQLWPLVKDLVRSK